MDSILESGRFVAAQPIEKGLSSDQKHRVTTADGAQYLLRVSPAADYPRKQAEYHMLTHMYAHGIPAPRPWELGLCDGGARVYSLVAWLEGADAESLLPGLSTARQYALGRQSGRLLRQIHAVPAPASAADTPGWPRRFAQRLGRWVAAYDSKPAVHSETGRLLREYLLGHAGLLDGRPQTCLHGDYNTENLLVSPSGGLSVIDFNSYGSPVGDPWWDLNNMAWSPTLHPHFQTGQLEGYFGGQPPEDFWPVFACYLAFDALAALTDPFELNGIEDGTPVVRAVLGWTDGLRRTLPRWYVPGGGNAPEGQV